jgi:predicted porin
VPGAQISFIAERLDNKNIVATNGLVVAGLAAPLDDPKVYIFLVNWEHMLGQWQLLAMYGWSGNVKGLSISNDQTRARAFTLGAKYFLSKRTGIYVSLNQFRNERNAWGDFVGAGNSSATGGALRANNRGADPRIIAVGVMHNF